LSKIISRLGVLKTPSVTHAADIGGSVGIDGDVTLTQTANLIKTDSADASDTKSVTVTAASAAAASRGSYVTVRGNEVGSGSLSLVAGAAGAVELKYGASETVGVNLSDAGVISLGSSGFAGTHAINGSMTLTGTFTPGNMSINADTLVLNADAAGSGTDWTATLSRNTTSMGAAGTYTLPIAADTLVGRLSTDTLANKTLTAPAINAPTLIGGTIANAAVDNTSIGATTRSSGAFTTLAANAATTLTSTLDVTGATTLSSTLGVSGVTTLGPVSGLTSAHIFRSGSASGSIDVRGTANDSTSYMGFSTSSGTLRAQIGAGASSAFEVFNQSVALVGFSSQAGAWTLGPASAIGGSTYAGNLIVGRTNGTLVAAGYVGETVENINTAGTSVTTTTAVNIATVALTPGRWLLTAVYHITNNSAVANANPTIILDVVSAGESRGDTTFSIVVPSGDSAGGSTSRVVHAVSGSLSYAVIINPNINSGSYTARGRITAIRIA